MYLGIQGLTPRNLNNVTAETMRKIRDHGFSGVACRYFDPLEETESEVKRLRDIMGAEEVCPQGDMQIEHLPDDQIPDARQSLYQTGIKWLDMEG